MLHNHCCKPISVRQWIPSTRCVSQAMNPWGLIHALSAMIAEGFIVLDSKLKIDSWLKINGSRKKRNGNSFFKKDSSNIR